MITLQQGPPGFEENTSPEALLLVGVAVLCLGFVLAFAGRLAWRPVMAFIGAVLGGLFGFVFGTAVGGVFVGLLVSMLGAVIGSMLFAFLMEIGLGMVAGLLTYIVVSAVTESFIVSALFAVAVFILTVVFVEEAIGVVTAVVGGLLVGIGLLWIDVADMLVVVIVMFGTMAFGAAFQLTAIREQMAARAASTAPVPPSMPSGSCSQCGGPLTYVSEYGRYYCHGCQRYE